MSRIPIRSFRPVFLLAATALPVALALAHPAAAQLTQKDVLIMGRALGQLEPAPGAGSVVAIVYSSDKPASKAAADAVLGFVGEGLKAGATVLKAKLVEAAALGDGTGFAAIIATPGSDSTRIMAAVRARHIPCVSGDPEQVRAGACVMSIRSDPKVEILVNRETAVAAGVTFASAFRMMYREI